MPHGLPDFGATSGKQTTYQLNDMAELAARLGSIVTFDRLGDVLLLEDFERGRETYRTAWAGTGGGGYRSLSYALSGAYSYKMVAGSDGQHFARLYFNVALPVLSRVGFEFAKTYHTAGCDLHIIIDVYTGAMFYEYELWYENATGKWYYLNPADSLVETGWVKGLSTVAGLFDRVKLVVNSECGKYQRLTINGEGVDLSDLSCHSYASAVGGSLLLEVRYVGKLGSNNYCWIDNVIVTQNEP